MHLYLSRFDSTVTRWIKQLPDWLSPLMRFVSFIGEPAYVLVVALIVAGIAYSKGSFQIVKMLFVGFVGFALNTGLKYAVHRERPASLVEESFGIKSYSFPSGHAFCAVFFIGLLTYFASTRLPQPWNIILSILLVALILVIGVSRVYLGFHYPSDIVAGYALGALCLFLAIKLFKP